MRFWASVSSVAHGKEGCGSLPRLPPGREDDRPLPFLLTRACVLRTPSICLAWESKDIGCFISLHFIILIWKPNSPHWPPDSPSLEKANAVDMVSNAIFPRVSTLSEAGKRNAALHTAVRRKLEPTWSLPSLLVNSLTNAWTLAWLEMESE